MALKALALARIACPDANVVTYAALAPSDTDGLMLGLQYGANVVMPRLTSAKYQNLYRVYPAPSYAHGPNSPSRVKTVLDKLGRPQAQGRGHRRDRKAEASRSSGKKPGEGLAVHPDSSLPTS
jgi:biotin synthase